MTEDDDEPILAENLATDTFEFETTGDPSVVVTIDDYLNHAGFGIVGIMICLGAGIGLFMYGALLTWLALVLSILSCRWSLSDSDIMVIRTCTLLGVLIGAALSGVISDKVGRRYVVLFGSYIAIIFWLLTAATDEAVWFAIMYFLVGVGFGILVPSSLIFAFEYTSSQQHTRAFLFLFGMYFLGEMYALVTYYLIVEYIGWKLLTVLIALPLVLLIVFLHLTPDSLKFLNISGRCDHCYLILLKIHQKQGVPMKQGTLLSIERTTRGECSVLFGKKFLKQTLLLSVIYFILTMCYYFILYSYTLTFDVGYCGLSQDADSSLPCMTMSDRAVVRSLVAILPEIGGLFVGMFLAETSTRKSAMGALIIVSAGATFSEIICFGVVLFLVEMAIARACVSGGLIILYMYTLEVYGTYCRATAFSWLWVCGLLGAIVSIFLGVAFEKSVTALLMFVGIMLVVVVLPMVFLSKQNVYEDIDDTENVPIINQQR